MANLVIIKELLRQKRYTIRQFSSEIGITEQGLQNIIKQNSTKVETLEKIAKALDVPVSIFFDDAMGNISGNQSVSGNGNNIVGHGSNVTGNVNITLPDRGFQKIIRSDGTETTVEVASSCGEVGSRELACEVMALQKENSELKSKIIELQGRLLNDK